MPLCILWGIFINLAFQFYYIPHFYYIVSPKGSFCSLQMFFASLKIFILLSLWMWFVRIHVYVYMSVRTCVPVCRHIPIRACMWRSEDNIRQMVLTAVGWLSSQAVRILWDGIFPAKLNFFFHVLACPFMLDVCLFLWVHVFLSWFFSLILY